MAKPSHDSRAGRGPRGRQGTKGPRGSKGTRGSKGARGATGARGAEGAKGDRGPDASADYIFSIVEDQFREIREHLHVQLVRTGQLQVNLDRHHQELAETREQLNQVHALLTQYLRKGIGLPSETKSRDFVPD